MKRIALLLLISAALLFVSCGLAMRSMYPAPQPEKMAAIYPKYRIDDRIHKICIIGSGPGKAEISSSLGSLMTQVTNIKIIETGNLQQVLGGKILQYGTDLGPTESQAVAQMLQVDSTLCVNMSETPSPW